MSSRSSIEDLFESESLDSDDTVDLSVPSKKKKSDPVVSQIVIVESDSDAELLIDNMSSHLDKGHVAESSSIMGQQDKCNIRRTTLHSLSSSESESETSTVTPQKISPGAKTLDFHPKTTELSKSRHSKAIEPHVSMKHNISMNHSGDRDDTDEDNLSCSNNGTLDSMQKSVDQAKCKETWNMAADGRAVCQYGRQCYRKNPDHLKRFWHPGR